MKEGTAIEIGVKDMGVKDIGVSEIGVNDNGVKVRLDIDKEDAEEAAPPSSSNSLQLKSLQHPCTPFKTTQCNPLSQLVWPLQHSPPSGAQF